jgi:hypothetical protein
MLFLLLLASSTKLILLDSLLPADEPLWASVCLAARSDLHGAGAYSRCRIGIFFCMRCFLRLSEFRNEYSRRGIYLCFSFFIAAAAAASNSA